MELTQAGAGATGGIATLLVKLGDALAATDGVAEVLTIGRGIEPSRIGRSFAEFEALQEGIAAARP